MLCSPLRTPSARYHSAAAAPPLLLSPPLNSRCGGDLDGPGSAYSDTALGRQRDCLLSAGKWRKLTIHICICLGGRKGSGQGPIASMDKTTNVVLDIEGLPQPPDKCCSGSPKMIRALSRKGSNRMERRGGDEQEQEDLAKKLIIKVVPSQLEQPLGQNKALVAPHCTPCTPVLIDSGEGRSKRFSRFTSINPRKILLLFATLSSVGTTILIYFTLAINSKAEA